jgi:hypothetical protein
VAAGVPLAGAGVAGRAARAVVAVGCALDDAAAAVVEVAELVVELTAELLDELLDTALELLDEVLLVPGVAVGDAPPQAVTSRPPAARPVRVRKRRRVNRTAGRVSCLITPPR